MKILIIYRNPPDEQTRLLASAWETGNDTTHFHLYDAPVDYALLIEEIFNNDKVLTLF